MPKRAVENIRILMTGVPPKSFIMCLRIVYRVLLEGISDKDHYHQ
jgi:hypothetical protein